MHGIHICKNLQSGGANQDTGFAERPDPKVKKRAGGSELQSSVFPSKISNRRYTPFYIVWASHAEFNHISEFLSQSLS